MSADGDTVRDALNARGLLGDDRRQGALVALARLEAAEAQRDALAKLLQEALEEWGEQRLAYASNHWIDSTCAALAEEGLE